MTITPVIAIVDDDEFVREAMGHLIRSFDFSVELFGSGQDLLNAATLPRINCIITDVQMPEMTGFDMCDQLRTRGLRVPIVFMTAFVKEGYAKRARESGAVCFLHKPFQDTDVLRCLERALNASDVDQPGASLPGVTVRRG